MSAFVINPYSFSKAFSPNDVGGLAAWLDFSDSSTLFDATTGGSTPSNGGNIRRIEDKSGNSLHFVQTDSTRSPVRAVAQINGLDVGNFTTDSMWSNSTPTLANGAALFIVVQRTADGNGGVHAIRGRGGSDNNHHPFSGAYYDSFAITTRESWTQAYSSNIQLYAVTFDGSGTWKARINGATVKTSTGRTGANPLFGLVIGIGTNSGSTSFAANGYYCEVLLYDDPVADSDRDDIEQYLAEKWGITL